MLDGLKLGLYVLVLHWEVVNLAHDLDGFALASPLQEPTWRFWEPEQKNDDRDSKDELDSDGETPCDLTTCKAHSKIKPVGERDANTNEQDFPRDETASDFLATELGLIHWYSRTVDSGSKAGDDTPDDEVWHVLSRCLERGADDDEALDNNSEDFRVIEELTAYHS